MSLSVKTDTCLTVKIEAKNRAEFFDAIDSFKDAIPDDARFYHSKARLWFVLPEASNELQAWIESQQENTG